jgi:hypothetical protein
MICIVVASVVAATVVCTPKRCIVVLRIRFMRVMFQPLIYCIKRNLVIYHCFVLSTILVCTPCFSVSMLFLWSLLYGFWNLTCIRIFLSLIYMTCSPPAWSGNKSCYYSNMLILYMHMNSPSTGNTLLRTFGRGAGVWCFRWRGRTRHGIASYVTTEVPWG